MEVQTVETDLSGRSEQIPFSIDDDIALKTKGAATLPVRHPVEFKIKDGDLYIRKVLRVFVSGKEGVQGLYGQGFIGIIQPAGKIVISIRAESGTQGEPVADHAKDHSADVVTARTIAFGTQLEGDLDLFQEDLAPKRPLLPVGHAHIDRNEVDLPFRRIKTDHNIF